MTQSGTTINVLKMPKIFTSQENRTKLPDRSDGSTRCFEAPFAGSPFQCFISDREKHHISKVAKSLAC